jgi:toxin CcdB
MAQFDVFRHTKSRRYPYLLDLQADLLRDLATRIVAPLLPLARLRGKPIGTLNPVIPVAGEPHVIVFQELAAFPASELGDAVASLHARRGELIAAIDLLFTGI